MFKTSDSTADDVIGDSYERPRGRNAADEEDADGMQKSTQDEAK